MKYSCVDLVIKIAFMFIILLRMMVFLFILMVCDSEFENIFV